MHDEVEVEHRLTAVEKLSGSNRHRLDEVERRQNDLDSIVSAVACLKQEQGHIQEDVKEIKTDVKELASKPAKRMDKVIEIVVTALVSAVIGFIIAAIGLK